MEIKGKLKTGEVEDFKVGDRVRVKPECVGKHGRFKLDGGLGTIVRGDSFYNWQVLLDRRGNGLLWGYYTDELTLLEDTMEYTVNGVMYRQLKNITVKALILAGARDVDVDYFRLAYTVSMPIPLKATIDYASSCNEKLLWLVDQGFVEVVEEGYEVKVGDKYTIGDSELMLCGGLSSNKICLAVVQGNFIGRFWDGKVYPCQDLLKITLDEFKALLGQHHCESWEKIYATRVPYKKK